MGWQLDYLLEQTGGSPLSTNMRNTVAGHSSYMSFLMRVGGRNFARCARLCIVAGFPPIRCCLLAVEGCDHLGMVCNRQPFGKLTFFNEIEQRGT